MGRGSRVKGQQGTGRPGSSAAGRAGRQHPHSTATHRMTGALPSSPPLLPPTCGVRKMNCSSAYSLAKQKSCRGRRKGCVDIRWQVSKGTQRQAACPDAASRQVVGRKPGHSSGTAQTVAARPCKPQHGPAPPARTIQRYSGSSHILHGHPAVDGIHELHSRHSGPQQAQHVTSQHAQRATARATRLPGRRRVRAAGCRSTAVACSAVDLPPAARPKNPAASTLHPGGPARSPPASHKPSSRQTSAAPPPRPGATHHIELVHGPEGHLCVAP